MRGISVIIPVYNQEKYLNQAIESVLSQDYPGKKELIISDDGSTDRTIEIAESYLPNVVILRKPQNCNSQGVSGTRNRGIQAATQDLICFLDSDDFYLPNHLINISSAIESNGDYGFAFCRIIEVREIENQMKYREWTQQIINKNDIINPVLTRAHIVHTNAFIFKREVFTKAGLFNENYSNGEDGDLWMRISELIKGGFSNHFGAAYRTKHSLVQLTNNQNDKIRYCYKEIYDSALTRYYNLNLNDRYRLFKIKQFILRLNYSDSRLIYYLKYILIIMKFPIPFIIHRYENYLDYKFIKGNRHWKDLNIL